MPRYSGDVTLPDGRQFRAVVIYGPTEPDTNAATMRSCEIYYMDDTEVPVEVQNEPLKVLLPNYHDCIFLWELVHDLVLLTEPDYDYDHYDPSE